MVARSQRLIGKINCATSTTAYNFEASSFLIDISHTSGSLFFGNYTLGSLANFFGLSVPFGARLFAPTTDDIRSPAQKGEINFITEQYVLFLSTNPLRLPVVREGN